MRKFTPGAKSLLNFRSLIILILVLVIACEKNDHHSNPPAETNLDKTKFYSIPKDAGPELQAVAQKLNRLEKTYHYAEKWAKKLGMPYWNNVVISEAKENTRFSGQVQNSKNGNDKKFLYIPIADTAEQKTNAVLIAAIHGPDTSFHMLYPQHYKNFGFDRGRPDGWSAMNVFSIFAGFDQQLFGLRKYLVKDGRILGAQKKDRLTATWDPYFQSGRAGTFNPATANMVPISFCYSVTTSCVYADEGPYEGGGICNTEIFCTTFWIEGSPTGSGGGSDDDGTGGGGTYGDGNIDDHPPCDGPQGPAVRNSQRVDPPGDDGAGDDCEEPWEPADDQNPNQSIADSLSNYPCAQDVLRKLPGINAMSNHIIQEILGVNDQVEIQFTTDNNIDPDLDGITKKVAYAGGIFRATIGLNPAILQFGSKDYIAAVLIHEIIHSYIYYKKSTLPQSEFYEMFPLYQLNLNDYHHNIMAYNYVSFMSEIIRQINPGLSVENADALAWGGLQDTAAWPTLSNQSSIIEVNHAARFASLLDIYNYGLIKCQ